MDRLKLLNKLEIPDTISVIFQLTDKCVLSCKYCFAKGSYSEDRIQPTVRIKILKQAIMQSFGTRHKDIAFEWTGGEPFLAGINFYRKVVDIQKKYANKTFANYIQTSGYCYDKELIDFFVENGFIISTTIDGTKDVHNFNRPANRNIPSLNKILKTRDYIIKKQGYCGFISTVTKRNIGEEAKILEYFRSLKINSFHSNPYIFFDKNKIKDKKIALTNKNYAVYFINQFNAWIENGKLFPMPRTVSYILENIQSKTECLNTICSFGGKCLMNFISITPFGDSYLCPKFIGFKQMRLGNITESTISYILSEKNPRMSRLINERISAINICEKENCRFLKICNSGCPYYSFINSNGKNIKEKDVLCSGKKLVYQYIKSASDLIYNSN